MEVKAEEDPEDNSRIEWGGTNTSGKGTTFTQINSLSEYSWTVAPLVAFYIRSSLVVR